MSTLALARLIDQERKRVTLAVNAARARLMLARRRGKGIYLAYRALSKAIGDQSGFNRALDLIGA